THHVDQRGAPGAVDATRLRKHVVRYFVDAPVHEDAADLHLLGETDDVGGDAVVLVGPPATGEAKTRLYLVVDQERFVFIGQAAQLDEELGAKVVVAAFPLDRLHQDRGD